MIGQVVQVRKLALRSLGHAFYFQTEYLQLVHHIGHGFRNHSQIFTTNQHIRAAHQRSQATKGLRLPELIMAMIEKVPIQLIESIPVRGAQLAIQIGLAGRNARMKFILFTRIAQKQHFISYGKQPFLNPERHLVRLSGKQSFHLTLRITERFQHEMVR